MHDGSRRHGHAATAIRHWVAQGVLALVPLARRLFGFLRRWPNVWNRLRRLRFRLAHRVVIQAVSDSRARVQAARLPFGVNVAGYVCSEKGTGEAARATLKALQTVGIPHVANNVVDISSENRQPCRWGRHHPYRVNLLHANPDQTAIVAQMLGPRYLRECYNVGYWAWELSTLPAAYRLGAECLHEIWVPSEFVRQAVASAVEVPVIRIPHAIEISLREISDQQDIYGSRFSVETDNRTTTRFLCLFDWMSHWQRKNPFGVVEAFRRAFPNQEGVELSIKTMHASADRSAFDRLQRVARGLAVRVLDGVWTREAVLRLLAASDCVVSLHRAEGFGLVLAEAMALGKPVIATGYSGNVDFMTSDNSLLVDYRLIELEEDVGPYIRGSRWADPDLDHAAAHMRWVTAHREQARAIGTRASQAIQEGFSPLVVGMMMRERLLMVADGESHVPASCRCDDLNGAQSARPSRYSRTGTSTTLTC